MYFQMSVFVHACVCKACMYKRERSDRCADVAQFNA